MIFDFEGRPIVLDVRAGTTTTLVWPPAQGPRYPMEALIVMYADKHQPGKERGGCTCGFCAWSAEHVAIMAYREAVEHS